MTSRDGEERFEVNEDHLLQALDMVLWDAEQKGKTDE